MFDNEWDCWKFNCLYWGSPIYSGNSRYYYCGKQTISNTSTTHQLRINYWYIILLYNKITCSFQNCLVWLIHKHNSELGYNKILTIDKKLNLLELGTANTVIRPALVLARLLPGHGVQDQLRLVRYGRVPGDKHNSVIWDWSKPLRLCQTRWLTWISQGKKINWPN